MLTHEPSHGDVRKLMPINNLIYSIRTLHLALADGTCIINRAPSPIRKHLWCLSAQPSHQHRCLHPHGRPHSQIPDLAVATWFEFPSLSVTQQDEDHWGPGRDNYRHNRGRRSKLRTRVEAVFIWPRRGPTLKAPLATHSQECYCYAAALTKEIISLRKSIHIWRQSCYRDQRRDGAFC